MLQIKIEHFLDYCKVSNFATRSIQSLRLRLNEFNRFIDKASVESVQGISYRLLKEFITQYRGPSIHVKKARIWSLRQFFHFLKLNGWIKTNIASDFPYPKIEKTIPHFLTIEEYNRLLNFFYCKASDASGFRNLVMIMMLGLLGLRLSSITLLIILAIDAFRTLFESIYFGAWYTSLVGFIPRSIHDFLVHPENVFVPKILNLFAAFLIIFIVLRRWIPEEEAERERELEYLKKLEKEKNFQNL
jgi:hypothetical protein